jgi:hypothetical protein
VLAHEVGDPGEDSGVLREGLEGVFELAAVRCTRGHGSFPAYRTRTTWIKSPAAKTFIPLVAKMASRNL